MFLSEILDKLAVTKNDIIHEYIVSVIKAIEKLGYRSEKVTTNIPKNQLARYQIFKNSIRVGDIVVSPTNENSVPRIQLIRSLNNLSSEQKQEIEKVINSDKRKERYIKRLNSDVRISGHSIKQKDGKKVLGKGIQSVAIERLRDSGSNQITLIFGFNDDDDGHLSFIRLAQKHQDNIFFPRIYSLKVYKNKPFRLQRSKEDYQYRFEHTAIVKMEKLHSSENPKIRNVVTNFLRHTIKTNRADFGNSIQRTKNTSYGQFEEAKRILNTQLKNNNFFMDVHSKNFMVRITSTGPQIVITDPFLSMGLTTPYATIYDN